MSSRLQDMTQQRLEKLERLRQKGVEPFPASYRRSHTTAEALDLFQRSESEAEAVELSLAGRITAMRVMGKAAFMDVKDGSGKVQAYFRSAELGPEKYELLHELDLGDFIGVKGCLFRTRTGEVTLRVAGFQVLAKALQPLPEKWHGLADVEKRYRQRYLDLIANEESRRVFVLRSQVISGIRRFLDGRGYLEVDTPVLQPFAGGAAARPFITHHQALDRDFYLRIATELYLKRLIVGGFDKVYEIGRIFRNEGISIKHNPEFTLLESYEAYADYRDIMAMVEEMISTIAREVLGTTKVKHGEAEIELAPPWPRLTLRQAIRDASGIDFEDYPDAASLRHRMAETGGRFDLSKGRGKLIDELLSTFVEPKLMQPTFLTEYPVELSPLAKRMPDNPRLVERFEAFAGGLEVANAFSELNDPLDQRERFRQQAAERAAGDDEAELPDEDFLLALEHGMPPTGGLGVGIDRLVMLLADQPSIRDVILFPQLRTKE